jgi:hypothetical protein
MLLVMSAAMPVVGLQGSGTVCSRPVSCSGKSHRRGFLHDVRVDCHAVLVCIHRYEDPAGI